MKSPSHRASKLSDLNLWRIRETPEGEDRLDWPNHLWPTATAESSRDTHPLPDSFELDRGASSGWKRPEGCSCADRLGQKPAARSLLV